MLQVGQKRLSGSQNEVHRVSVTLPDHCLRAKRRRGNAFPVIPMTEQRDESQILPPHFPLHKCIADFGERVQQEQLADECLFGLVVLQQRQRVRFLPRAPRMEGRFPRGLIAGLSADKAGQYASSRQHQACRPA